MAGMSAAHAEQGGCAQCWNNISMSLIACRAYPRFGSFGVTP